MHARRDRGRESGQALVEFALVLPVLLLMLVLFLEMGLVLITWNGMFRAAGTGARLVATGYDADVAEVMVREMLRAGTVDDGDVTIRIRSLDADGTPKCDPLGASCPVEYGDFVQVSLSKPFVFGILGYGYRGTLQAEVTQKAERGEWVP